MLTNNSTQVLSLSLTLSFIVCRMCFIMLLFIVLIIVFLIISSDSSRTLSMLLTIKILQYKILSVNNCEKVFQYLTSVRSHTINVLTVCGSYEGNIVIIQFDKLATAPMRELLPRVESAALSD